MSCLGRLQNDFNNNLFVDFGWLQVVLIVLLLIPLAVTFSAKRIAAKYKQSEEEVMSLAVKIKTVALIVAAAMAIVIMQII